MASGASIQSLRKRIDDLDSRIVKLLNERAATAIRIGERKRKTDAPIFVPNREEKVLRHVAAVAKKHAVLSPDAIRNIYAEVISACRSAEKHITVAFLGPRGTFSHHAARQARGIVSLARHAARRRFGTSVELLPVNGVQSNASCGRPLIECKISS